RKLVKALLVGHGAGGGAFHVNIGEGKSLAGGIGYAAFQGTGAGVKSRSQNPQNQHQPNKKQSHETEKDLGPEMAHNCKDKQLRQMARHEAFTSANRPKTAHAL